MFVDTGTSNVFVMERSESQDEKQFPDTRRSIDDDAGSDETGSQGKPPAIKKRRKSEDSGSSLQERWDEMFERLRRYKEAKGNCNVPNRYEHFICATQPKWYPFSFCFVLSYHFSNDTRSFVWRMQVSRRSSIRFLGYVRAAAEIWEMLEVRKISHTFLFPYSVNTTPAIQGINLWGEYFVSTDSSESAETYEFGF
jgi:Helicase associated domain